MRDTKQPPSDAEPDAPAFEPPDWLTGALDADDVPFFDPAGDPHAPSADAAAPDAAVRLSVPPTLLGENSAPPRPGATPHGPIEGTTGRIAARPGPSAPPSQAPPADIVAERGVIASCLLDPNSVALAQTHVKHTDFYDRRHALVFRAIEELSLAGRDADVMSVFETLGRLGAADKVGLTYLVELSNHPSAVLSLEPAARRVAKLAAVHRLAGVAQRLAADAFRPGLDPDEYIISAEGALRTALQDSVKGGAHRVGDIAPGVYQRAIEAGQRKGQLTGISTGYRDIDRMTHGLHASDLIVLAARPGVGKTSFAMNLALHVAFGRKRDAKDEWDHPGVLVFSLEMGKEQLVQRLISARSGVPLTNLRTGDMNVDAQIEVRNAVADLNELPFFIDDTPGLTSIDVRARAKRVAQGPHGLDLVVIDYLQLMRGATQNRNANREEQVSEASRSLKGLAKELGCTVMALSQLNRAVEREKDHRPKLADLRESGAIEQDADIVAFIYREFMYTKNPEDENKATLMIAKHRAGELGDVALHFDGRLTKFTTVANVNDHYAGY